jgi:hypothetical protein
VKVWFRTPLLAGGNETDNQAPTAELFGVAFVLLNSIKHIDNVRPLKYNSPYVSLSGSV